MEMLKILWLQELQNSN